MLRVLHLRPAHTDLQTRQAVHHLSKTAPPSISAQVLHVGPAGDLPNLAAAALFLRSPRAPEADILHAWGPVELTAAALAGHPRIIFSPQSTFPLRWQKWLRLIYRHRRINTVLPSPHMRCLLDVDTSLPSPTIIPPGVHVSDSIATERNELLRAELGFAPDDFVTLLPGESTRPANHKDALWGLGILYSLSDKYRALIWGRGEMSSALQRLTRQMHQEPLIVRAEQTLKRQVDFESLLSVADAAATSADRGAPMLPTLLCMAAGLPVAAYRMPVYDGILRPNENALINDLRTSRTLAQCLIDLRADPALRKRLGQAARKTAIESFSIEQFQRRWIQEYERVADQESSTGMSSRLSDVHLPL
jgi:glycosyltransferase involved in cell wall biosynthesis